MLENLVHFIEKERESVVLNNGATQSDIDRLKSLFPADSESPLIDLYTKANGENYSESDQRNCAPYLIAEYCFMSIDEIIYAHDFQNVLYNDWMDDGGFEPYYSFPDGMVKPMRYNPLWIPFGNCCNEMYLAIDLSPGEKGMFNQVIAFGRALTPNVYWVAPSIDDAFEKIYRCITDKELQKRSEPFEGFTNILLDGYHSSR